MTLPEPQPPLPHQDSEPGPHLYSTYADERADIAIADAERATQLALRLLEQAKELRANDPPHAEDTAAFAAQAARLGRPILVQRDAPVEFARLADLLSRRAEQFAVIKDMPQTADENLHLRLLLVTLTQFIDTAKDIRRSIVVRDINKGNISRKQAAEILGVHQQTIANWVKEDAQAQNSRPSSPSSTTNHSAA